MDCKLLCCLYFKNMIELHHFPFSFLHERGFWYYKDKESHKDLEFIILSSELPGSSVRGNWTGVVALSAPWSYSWDYPPLRSAQTSWNLEASGRPWSSEQSALGLGLGLSGADWARPGSFSEAWVAKARLSQDQTSGSVCRESASNRRDGFRETPVASSRSKSGLVFLLVPAPITFGFQIIIDGFWNLKTL